jgi:hypothetical protein
MTKSTDNFTIELYAITSRTIFNNTDVFKISYKINN